MKKKVFKGFNNQKIGVGSLVSFEVENQDDWGGNTSGILIFEDKEFKIQTERSGVITIGKGYDAYPGTIREIKKQKL